MLSRWRWRETRSRPRTSAGPAARTAAIASASTAGAALWQRRRGAGFDQLGGGVVGPRATHRRRATRQGSTMPRPNPSRRDGSTRHSASRSPRPPPPRARTPGTDDVGEPEPRDLALHLCVPGRRRRSLRRPGKCAPAPGRWPPESPSPASRDAPPMYTTTAGAGCDDSST